MNFLRISWYFKTLIIIGIILILMILTVVISRTLMNYRTNQKIDTLYESLAIDQEEIIKDQDINHLPKPVYKWLIKSGVVGKRKIQKVSLKQTGQMRLNPEDAWLKPDASQEINVSQPGYVWTVNLPMAMTKGRDFFYQGQGQMLIKIGGLIPIVNENNNDKINESSMHRFLMEIAWYPTAAIEDYIEWTAINDHQARATMTYQEIKITADFFFENNDLIRVETMRYKDTGEFGTRELCIGQIIDYETYDGFRLPSKINISWKINSDTFTWYKIEVTEFLIN
ncbi:hypothetical protein KHQ88_01390 [Mycoplasmatota bacterium]|nr:hypothetical protein KHQ88_01390 [Mycoplasmatota bacterium]